MKNILHILIFIFFVAHQAGAQDIEGSSDHPILTRYPESSIAFYYQKEYNELQMATAVVDSKAGKLLDVKGKHTSILYKGPKGRSTTEIFRNYENAIREAGGEILFSCSGQYAPEGCDNYNKYYGLKFFDSVYRRRRTNNNQYTYLEGGSNNQAYLTAQFDRGNTITYVEIGITGKFLSHPSSIQLEIVEVSRMDGGLITAESIKEQLEKYGKVQIYTIFFATNSAIIEQGSGATLEAITDFLQKYPDEKLYVVGHTDDTGKIEYNRGLSEERAQAVVAELQSMLKADLQDRLHPYGVGPLSPEGSNRTEDGKTANRRVELVRRLR